MNVRFNYDHGYVGKTTVGRFLIDVLKTIDSGDIYSDTFRGACGCI